MTIFAHCFLLVFGQLAVGGFFAIGRLPFHDIERGFYKSSAVVFLTSALFISLGELTLLWRPAPEPSGAHTLEALAWTIFTLVAGVYVASLWGNPYRRRALAYLATLTVGVVALVTSASGFSPAPAWSLETVLYPISFLVSALLLGATASGMLLGHWYLIDVGMPLAPFLRMWRLYRTSLVLQLATLALSLALLHLGGGNATTSALHDLWGEHRGLLWTRLGLGPIPALAIAWMIWRTLQIPQTMAATGLFYVAVLTSVVGEFLGRFLLYRTSLPL
ncbi:MAG: hypothetical protein HY271_01870 [Deltaproteobacteria bacterium]|nr:hypothetical protein [Deltaproteobacteria bacterium]